MSLFTRLFPQSYPPHALIAPHPRLKYLRSVRVFFLIFVIVILVLTVGPALIARVTLGETAFPWPVLVPVLLWLCTIGFSFVIEQWWKPLETLRLAAVQGDQRLLADEQPQPNPEALDVPVKIAMHLSRNGLLVTGLCLILLFIALADAGFLLTEWLQHLLDASTWLLLLAMTVFVGTIMTCMLAIFWRQRWMVEVKEEGIRSWVKSSGMTENGASLMFWHEARLFACYRRPGPWNKNAPLTYELSSASQVVLWTWVQKQEPQRLSVTPTIPFDEHQTQMRALCDLVAAKTGLPLYDLSTERVLK